MISISTPLIAKYFYMCFEFLEVRGIIIMALYRRLRRINWRFCRRFCGSLRRNLSSINLNLKLVRRRLSIAGSTFNFYLIITSIFCIISVYSQNISQQINKLWQRFLRSRCNIITIIWPINVLTIYRYLKVRQLVGKLSLTNLI